MGHEELYLTHLRVIEDVIRFVCRRHALKSADAEDFASIVRIHLVEDEYRVLRSFQHRSSVRTFLTTVIQRQFLDWQNSRWGKWRPTTEARRRGPVAVLLERLVSRDGLTFEEAAETLRTNHQVSATHAELLDLARTFPPRARRRVVSDDVLVNVPDQRADAEVELHETERQRTARLTRAALGRVTAKLAHQDRLILRMRFEDDFTVADIARALRLDQKALYRRLDNLMAGLRRELEAEGVDPGVAQATLD